MYTTPAQLQEALTRISNESYILHQELATLVTSRVCHISARHSFKKQKRMGEILGDMKKSSLRSHIPPAIREILAQDPYMEHCVCPTGCKGRVTWHHAMTYSGKRVNALWSLIPLCEEHHSHLNKNTVVICNMNMRMRIRHFNSEETFKRDYPRSTLFDNLRVNAGH